jgi:acetoin:2,6-dichlorophenolindophenol oxidoreductase subunit alpha
VRTDDLDLLLMIRHFELTLLELSGRGTHTCLGREHVPVALGPLLCEGDHVFGDHRSHGHHLARHRDFDGLLAESMGRRHRCRCPSTGVRGRSLSVAAGVALHLKRTDPGRLVCAHLGDGAWGEDAAHEALDLAGRWELPLLVVVEGVARSAPADRHPAGIDHVRLTATDPDEIRDELGDRLYGVRAGRPLVAEFARGDMVGEHDWYPPYEGSPPDLAARACIETITREVSARPCA